MQFHERLKKYRKDRGLTQEELAEQLRVSRSSVAKWENGFGLPGAESLKDLASFFETTPEELLADRETESILVQKNSALLRQKKWLIGLIALVIAIIAAGSILLGVFLAGRGEEPLNGGGEVEITGIGAGFVAESELLDGDGALCLYTLQAGEKYAFYVRLYHRGSRDVRLGKGGVRIYYDTQFFAFDEGEYWEEPDRDATPADEYPFYFTCLDTAAYTEIVVIAEGYWCKVPVAIGH